MRVWWLGIGLESVAEIPCTVEIASEYRYRKSCAPAQDAGDHDLSSLVKPPIPSLPWSMPNPRG